MITNAVPIITNSLDSAYTQINTTILECAMQDENYVTFLFMDKERLFLDLQCLLIEDGYIVETYTIYNPTSKEEKYETSHYMRVKWSDGYFPFLEKTKIDENILN